MFLTGRERKTFLSKMRVIGLQFYLVKGLSYRCFIGENFRSKYSVKSFSLAFFLSMSWIWREKMKSSKLMEDKSLHSCIRGDLLYSLGCVTRAYLSLLQVYSNCASWGGVCRVQPLKICCR